MGKVRPTPERTAGRTTARLACSDGATIAYQATTGKHPGLVFLGGFRSDMTGSKASALDAFARRRGRAFLRFDYSGHGQSSGRFEEGTIGRWREQALEVLDRLTEGPQVLIGSSMGGWIMLLVALARPDRVAALVGIAAAPDFTEDLLWSSMDEEARAALLATGLHLEPSDYDPEPLPITRQLIEEGRQHLLLGGEIALTCPVRLLHGLKDRDVPWQTSLRLAERLAGQDVELHLVKNGDHRLSSEADLTRLEATLDRLLGELARR